MSAQVTVPAYLDGGAGRRFCDVFGAQKPQMVDFLSARLTLGGLDRLRTQMPEPKHLRILLPPTGDAVPNEAAPNQVYQILSVTPAELILTNQLKQRQHAKLVQAWLRQESIEVRTLESPTALTWMAILGGSTVVVGNPEISSEGLSGEESMAEAGLTTLQAEACSGLRSVYERWWALGTDIKAQLIERMDVYWKPNAPQFIYYLSLWHLFADQLKEYRKTVLDDRHLEDTPIWKSLYAFQCHGAKAAMNMIEQQGGCILADSVGLGKTYTALAVIKAYERMGKQVLVLVPKKLRDNWARYLSSDSGNPFLKPNGKADFDYYLACHTDLVDNRDIDIGEAAKVPAKDFFEKTFDLVVIDESHNFRNSGGSRYKFLLEKVIKAGLADSQTKLLLLSATPVNNRLKDLTHQIALIRHVILNEDTTDGETPSAINSEKKNAFREIQHVLSQSQKKINAWNKEHAQDDEILSPAALQEILPEDYFQLLSNYTIARSREGIMRYYANASEEIGAFPEHKMVPRYPKLDTEGELDDIKPLSDRLNDLSLVAYNPTSLLVAGVTFKEKDERYKNLTDQDRQNALVPLMRMNALKRLESSVDSFRKTLKESLLERTQAQLDALERGVVLVPAILAKGLDITEEEFDEADEEIKGIYSVPLKYFDERKLREKLSQDKAILLELLARADQVTPKRDGKLQELVSVLQEKVANPLNPGNVKAIVFTSFADTAEYLFKELGERFHERSIAMVTGQNVRLYEAQPEPCGKDRPEKGLKMAKALQRFAPKAQKARDLSEPPIDWLIATDCLSEGQNLQDCDFIVNWDIHWNPLRLVQRAGRIDRIGSENSLVHIVHFWPMKNLDEYIGLERRVRTKDAVVAVAGGGTSSVDDDTAVSLKYRQKQLQDIQENALDAFDPGTIASSNNFGFRDYLADLDTWLTEARELECRTAPFGLCTFTKGKPTEISQALNCTLPEQFVLFLLKRNDLTEEDKKANPLRDCYLVAVDAKGAPLGSASGPMTQVQALRLFRELCQDQPEVDTETTARLEKRPAKALNPALEGALRSLDDTYSTNRLQMLLNGAPFDFHSGRHASEKNLTLLTFAVIDGGAR